MNELNSATDQPPCCGQSGIGMIEILVTILVVAVGFLGIAALQMRSLSANNDAMTRSMASIAGYSILDAMRTDRNNLAAYETTVQANACADIDAHGFALVQLQNWCKHLQNNTTGEIDCQSSGSDKTCTVTMSFADRRADGETIEMQITTQL